MKTTDQRIPRGLRVWFVIHFIVDMIVAVPLFIVPNLVLPWFGWSYVDPIASRLVAAALLGIGGVSLLSNHGSREVYHSLLNLKIIWASAAVLGIGLGILTGGPSQAWLFVFLFLIFLFVWVYYKRKI